MNMITIIFAAFGLAMDSFAISITSGITIKRPRLGDALKIAVLFGLFHYFVCVRTKVPDDGIMLDWNV